MRNVIYLLLHLLTALATLLRPDGSRTIIAENLLLKQQLIIHTRSRQRAPNLTMQDRTVLGFLSLFLNPKRIVRAAIIIKPSTLLHFHNALKKRKYRLLYSTRGGKKPGPKGPSKEIISAIVEMKRRNPRYGCPRIAQQINEHRCHSSRESETPIERDSKKVVDINNYRWEKHCRGLFQLPVAA
jgi:putative transposase